jgi:alpha-beta hydrolase superfamily lysophospholipase
MEARMLHRISFPSDGLKLSGVLHVPDSWKAGQQLATFIVLHGFVGSKDESHAEIQATILEEMGYAAFRFDFRCCGESDGEKGQVRCFDQVVDAKNALTFISGREEVDPERIGVVGHSFGAAVAIYAGGVDQRFACVLSSCGWGDGERKFRGQHPSPEAWEKFTGILEKGRRHKRETGESQWMSRFDAVPIPEHLRRNLSPKALMEVPVETAWSMYNFRADEVVGNIAPRPLLLLHTADDAITPTSESICLFQKAGMPTELALITGTSHFPLNETDRPRTKIVIKNWLDKFFPAGPRG